MIKERTSDPIEKTRVSFSSQGSNSTVSDKYYQKMKV